MISQNLLLDESFNSLSVSAQNIFVRMLVVSDDYGVVPASEYVLRKLINIPESVKLMEYIQEIVDQGLGKRFRYDGKPFFIYKRDRFDEYQSYLIKNRRKSEYLRLTSQQIQEFSGGSGKFLELPGTSRALSHKEKKDIR